MKRVWIIAKNTLSRLKAFLVISVVVGVLLGLLLQLFMGIFGHTASVVRIGMLDADNSAASYDLAEYCTERLNMELIVDSPEALDTELIEKHISAIVEVPAGFEHALLDAQQSSLPLHITFMDDYANQVFLEMYLQEYAASLELLAHAAQGDAARFAALLAEVQNNAVELSTEGLSAELFQRQLEMDCLIPIIGFASLAASFVAMSIAFLIFDDRKLGVYQRVRASSVNALQYVLGICVAGFISALVLVASFLCTCVSMGFGQTISLGIIALECTLFILFMVAAALLCGLLFENKTSIIALMIGATTFLSLLGGAWFPLKYVPTHIQQLAHLAPQFWLMDAFYQYAEGATDAWILSAVVLALFAALCFLAAGIRFVGNRSNAI
jgi:ABC-2 type transport system permease protein